MLTHGVLGRAKRDSPGPLTVFQWSTAMTIWQVAVRCRSLKAGLGQHQVNGQRCGRNICPKNVTIISCNPIICNRDRFEKVLGRVRASG